MFFLASVSHSKLLILFSGSNNENKPVTNSRDTQEVLLEPGKEILKIFKNFQHATCLLDDFEYYNRRQELRNAGIDPDSVDYTNYSNSSTTETTDSSHFYVPNASTNTKIKSIPHFKKPPSTKPKDITYRRVNFNNNNNSNTNNTTNNSRRLLRRN
jgi:hypothetical protein